MSNSRYVTETRVSLRLLDWRRGRVNSGGHEGYNRQVENSTAERLALWAEFSSTAVTFMSTMGERLSARDPWSPKVRNHPPLVNQKRSVSG